MKTVMRDAFEQARVFPGTGRGTLNRCVRALKTKSGTHRKLVKRGNSDGPRPKDAGRWSELPRNLPTIKPR